MADNNTVILRVALDEGKTEERLRALVLDMEATRKAQAALTLARKNDQISTDEYAKQVVDLRTKLSGQTKEYAAQSKNLELYRTATGDLANTYKGTQAQLSLAQRQYQQLENSQDNSTESTQALSKVIEELRTGLTKTDETQKLFIRNVGNYPKGENLESLVKQLVKLQEETKGLTAGTEEAARAQMRIIGFQTQAAQAGAKEGKTFEETTNFIKEYSEAIRPATSDLVKLTQRQQELAESTEDVGEEMAQIGFKIGSAQSAIKKASDALKEVPEAAADGAKETKGLGAGLLEAAKSSDVLGGAVEVLSTAKEKYTTAVNLAKAATAAEVGVLGLFRTALLATGLGAFVVILGLVVSGLLKSQAATDFLSRKMAFLGGVIQPVINLGAELAEKLVAAAEDPKQAFEDLVQFIETNVVNRFKAVGVIIDAIRNRDFTKLTDGVVQLGTGLTNATARAKAFGQEMATVARSAEAIERETQRIREAERALNVARDESRAKIEGLKKASDDSTKSVATRTAAAKEAARIENGLLAEQQKLQDDKIKNLQAEQALKKSLTTEDKDALANLRRERAQTVQESLTLQTELQNKINSLAQEGIDKSIEGRAQALALESALLDKQLAQVKANTDEELSLQQAKLRTQYQAELNVKNLTLAQKRIAETKYEQQSNQLFADSLKARALAAYDAELASVNAELALVKSGTDQETALRREAIETQLQKELQALDKRKDNAAQETLLRANAAKAINDVNYGAALANLEKYLQSERNALLERNAKGQFTEQEYNRLLLASDTQAAAMRLQLAKDYGQDVTQLQQALVDKQLEIQQTLTEKEKERYRERAFAARDFGQSVGQLIADSLFEQGATIQEFLGKVLILVLDTIQKQLIAQQTASIASASIQAIAQPDSVATFGASGFARIAILSAAITTFFEIFKAGVGAVTAPSQQFADGGIAYGPSHAQGGIDLYYRGRSASINIEGGEPVLTKRVTENPLLLSLASTVNQLAGGRALVPNFPTPHMALGGVAQPLVLDQLRGNAGPPASAEAIGKAVADSLRKNPPINRWSDFKAAESRDAFTQTLASD